MNEKRTSKRTFREKELRESISPVEITVNDIDLTFDFYEDKIGFTKALIKRNIKRAFNKKVFQLKRALNIPVRKIYNHAILSIDSPF